MEPSVVFEQYPRFKGKFPLSIHLERFCIDTKILDAADVGSIRATRTKSGLVLVWAPREIASKIFNRKFVPPVLILELSFGGFCQRRRGKCST